LIEYMGGVPFRGPQAVQEGKMGSAYKVTK
jgi:hypothetical protein